ncbi:MAG: hypothetical protein ABIK62_03385, partial [candidate division WOR-3 bacterium]
MKTILNSLTLALVLCLPGCRRGEPSLPAKGAIFVDSLYQTSLVRVSDKNLDNYSGHGIQNEYAKADAWNSDGSYLILRSNDGIFYLYSGTDYRLLRNLDPLGQGQELEPRWAVADPDRFYYLAATCLCRYTVSSGTIDTVHDFRNEFPTASYVHTGVEGDASTDQRYWAFMVADSSFELLAICVYDRLADQVIGTRSVFPSPVNFVTMDASGNHVVICYDTRPMQAFHRDFSHPVDFPTGALGHSDVALTQTGADVMVYQNIATDYIAATDLETGIETNLLAIPFDVNPDIGLHISGNCIATPGWVLVSTYGAEQPPSGKQHSWMDNLLFMLALSDSARVIKLAQ